MATVPEFEAVRTYCVSPSGVTVRWPELGTDPTLPLIETLVALLTDQERVVVAPIAIVDGWTVKLAIVGGGAGACAETVTVVDAVLLPPALDAVSVNVVFDAGVRVF